MKKNKSFSNFISEGGLWANIHKRRKAGKAPKKPGEKGYPKTLDVESKEVNEIVPAIAAIAVRKMATKKIAKKVATSKEEAYEPITTKRQQALAKAASEPKKPVTLPRAPWDKGTKVTYDKNGKVVKEGAMKRMSTGDGMDTFKKKPSGDSEVKSINKALMKKRNNPQEKDKDIVKINKSLANMRGEAFSARAIVKKPRAGDGKPMSNKPMVRSNSPEHKAAVKKYISGMKSRRPGNTTSTLPRQMKDPKKDAMVSKGGKVKVVDKSKEADHLKRGYVRAEQSDLEKTRSMAMQNKKSEPTKSSKRPPDEMREARTMMVTRPGSNTPIKITVDQWPSFKMRGYHHAEQKENMMTMKLINKMKKASPAAKKALEAPSRVDNKDDKKVNELTIADVRKATEKAKKRQEKERKATGKTSTSTTDLASRNEAKEFKPHMMYDPKTGKGYKANKEADHLRMKKMGYTHDDPGAKKVEESFITEKAKSGLAAKAKKSGISQSVLRSVYNRGMAAWKSGHRPGTTPQQWAMARVNSFITKGSGTWGGADKDLASKVRKEDVNPDCECEDCQCNPCECGDWRANMGPGAGGIPTNQAEKLGEAKLNEMHCKDCGCQYGNIDPDCDCPNDGSDRMGEHWTLEPYTEALDMKQRLARARSARKNKAKLAMGRKKAGRRIASMKVLKKRAQRAARKTLTKRLTKGIAKRDLTVGRKKEIEKKLDTKTFQVKANRLVKRTIKDIRKKEIARKRK